MITDAIVMRVYSYIWYVTVFRVYIPKTELLEVTLSQVVKDKCYFIQCSHYIPAKLLPAVAKDDDSCVLDHTWDGKWVVGYFAIKIIVLEE